MAGLFKAYPQVSRKEIDRLDFCLFSSRCPSQKLNILAKSWPSAKIKKYWNIGYIRPAMTQSGIAVDILDFFLICIVNWPKSGFVFQLFRSQLFLFSTPFATRSSETNKGQAYQFPIVTPSCSKVEAGRFLGEAAASTAIFSYDTAA